MRVLDSHLHLWDPEVLTYTWLEGPMAFRFADLELEHARLGLAEPERSVFVQAETIEDDFLTEVDWVAALAPALGIVGIVAGVRLDRGTDTVAHLEGLLAEPLVLEQLRADGEVTAIGIGSMVSDALAAAVRAADLDLIMVAGRYTLLEQPAAVDVLPACRETATGIVAASVFNSGLLASSEPRRDGRYEYGQLPDELWDRLVRIAAVCADHGVPLPAAAIQFPLQSDVVRSVVVGGSRPAQLQQNAEYAALEIPAALWENLSMEGLIPTA